MGAKAGFHAHDTRGQPPEGLNEGQPLDLAAKSNLAVGAKSNDVEDVLADIDADRGEGCNRVHGCFSGCCGVVLADYPRGGSSRSIPLADIDPAELPFGSGLVNAM